MNLVDRIRGFEPQMIADRRWLHMHPELSGQEKQTMDYIISALDEIGLGIHIVPNGGVIGVLGARNEEPCVLLRADTDALPIEESPQNLSMPRRCISQNAGVMHACGHDAHMAMLLCAARVLSAMKDEVPGCVLFVFERGEEKGGKGFLANLLPYIDQNFNVGTCYATHVRWDIPAGRMALLDGAAMAGGFGFDVMLEGQGGHGSRPDLAANPIDCFAALHQQIAALRMRAVAPDQVLTYSLGLVSAGSQANTIPNTLRFAGTVRTYDTAGAGERFADEMKKIIEHTSAAYGCGYTLTHFSKPLYEVQNHLAAVACAKEAIAGQIGSDVLTEAAPWMASESMSAYLKLWPGILSFTGIRNEQLGCGANHHTPQFDLDESAMAVGVCAACAYALRYLETKPKWDFRRRILSMSDLVSRSI